ncbi:signal transduction histidine kinase [Flavobacterium arsenatis]|uniref:histidine kinase n=1 Tax=Flavobacterium arsenatis TaxID=1484332 RepID=A0ABU1TN59_9FLAO|nr:ATP-binding protein [Flavobacterium arsenatis]MDR6967386.1 signal transduction histidine kinase [Flavobacterium arsenatis]
MQVTPNAEQFIEAVVYTFVAFVLMAVSLLLFFYYSRKKILKKELEKKDLELTHQLKLLEATLETQEKERQRIARDLHDDISSKLNIISLNAHLLASKNLPEKDFDEISSNIILITGQVLENSRRIAHDLLPPILDNFGLHAALEELCHSNCQGEIMNVTYNNPKEQIAFEKIDTKGHLHVFRIIQELINNSIKHGKASKIRIEVKNENNICHIHYSDNGIGFNIKQAEAKNGIGMKNIKSRTAFLNGKFEIKSIENKGIMAKLSF